MYKNYPEEEKDERVSMNVNAIKTSLKMKNKG